MAFEYSSAARPPGASTTEPTTSPVIVTRVIAAVAGMPPSSGRMATSAVLRTTATARLPSLGHVEIGDRPG